MKVTYRFSVVDLDRGSYPANWICVLPKGEHERLENSAFASVIQLDDPYLFALNLLLSAKKEFSDDRGIVGAIDSRLFLMQRLRAKSKPTNRK